MNAMNCFIMFSVAAVVLFVATVVWQIYAMRSILGKTWNLDLTLLNSNPKVNQSYLDMVGLKKLYVTVGLWISTIVCAISSVISLVIHLVG